jgi:hypothetical protein
MGYAGKTAKQFFRGFLRPGIRSAGTEAPLSHAEAQKCSSSKLNLDSDFMQLVVAYAVSSAALSMGGSAKAKLHLGRYCLLLRSAVN